MNAEWEEPSRRWTSGRWSLDLREGGELADIRCDGTVVLRAVQAVVRDHDWGTIPLTVTAVEEADDALVLRLRSEGGGSSFEGIVVVQVAPEGLGVTLDLVAQEPFETNRTGLVVLLPPGLAGAQGSVRHPDGVEEDVTLPLAISPHQPVRDIAGLAWRAGGVVAGVSFVGDVYEMEDQRNWTDASFKIYSRPLALPFPYRIAAGEHVTQTVAVFVEGEPDAAADATSETAATCETSETSETAETSDRIVLTPTGGPAPAIVLGASTAPDPAPSSSDPIVALLVELDLSTTNWRAALGRAAASGLPLDVRIVADGPLDEVVDELRDLDVIRLGVFDPADHVTHHDALDRLRHALPGVAVVGGVRSHFTELNREQHRIPLDRLDGATFATTPLFHATSAAQLVESVAMQRLVARQAAEIAGGLPVHVGPVTLRPRFNDVATAPAPVPTRDDLAEGYGAAFARADDPRQTSAGLAAWTIASAAALAVAGVASIAFFEEWGPRGIRSADGEPYPVAAAIAALAALQGGLVAGDSPDGLVWALGAGGTLLVANLDDRHRAITVSVGGREVAASVPALSWIRLENPT